MLDQEALEIVNARLSAENTEREHSFNLAVQRVQNDFAMRGAGVSGAVVAAVADVCVKEVDARANRVWEIVRELLRETKGSPSDADEATLYKQFDDLFMRYCYASPQRFILGFQRMGISRTAAAPANFENRAQSVRLRIVSEIKGFVRSRRQAAAEAEKSRTFGPAEFWWHVLNRAFEESEFKKPWKIWTALSTPIATIGVEGLFGQLG
jgi:hypothetical protein